MTGHQVEAGIRDDEAFGICNHPQTARRGQTDTRRKSKRWQRETIVAGTLCIRRREDEDDVRRRLLKRLQQGIEGRFGEHVNFVDQVNLESPPDANPTLSRRLRISSMPRLLAASSSIRSSDRPAM